MQLINNGADKVLQVLYFGAVGINCCIKRKLRERIRNAQVVSSSLTRSSKALAKQGLCSLRCAAFRVC